jgi:uncharacterized protein (TIGR02145 family)
MNIGIFLSIIALVVLLFNGCEKDNTCPSSNNQTNGKTTAVFNSATTYGSLTDQDFNVYKTVTIGTQIWMAENLRTTKYRDGSVIPEVNGALAWSTLTTGAYCNYNNTVATDTIATFGRLYNWYAISDSHNLAPAGWHIPSDVEWSQLTEYLGGEDVAGGKLKEIGTTHWLVVNTGATNETGFTALPGGSHFYNVYESFYYIGSFGNWWSTTENDTASAWYRIMYCNTIYVARGNISKTLGFSVRCIKD